MNHRQAGAISTLCASLTLVAACGDDGPSSGSTLPDSTAPDSTAPASSAPESTVGAEDTTIPGTTEPSGTSDADGTSGETVGTTGPTESSGPAEEPTIESAGDLVIGLSEDEAEEALDDRGWTLRVTRRDGEDLPVTMDLRPDRVNVEVVDGEVTEVLDIG